MTKSRTEIIESMKCHLLDRVDEWVGMDVPAEGTEDYETWKSKSAEIEAIENIQDVIEYVESEGIDLDDFFVCGEYKVLSAGLDAKNVPADLLTEAGELVAEKSCPSGSWVKVYFFDGKYFIINDVETTVAETETEALKIAGIESETFNQIGHSQDHQTTPPIIVKDRVKERSPSRETKGGRRPVLIVVTDWPTGTMAFKFGSALQTALGATKEDMNLMQMSPERIFRVETKVSETEFRKAIGSRDVASGGSILFVEIPSA
jgi:hypothetical protein